jgi:hypothetical protein
MPEDYNTGDTQSLVTAYAPTLFMPTMSWESLRRLLDRRGGGSIGISGPRGIGKTWLMEQSRTWAMRDNKGFAVRFPSPSEYEPTAFIAALSEVVAKEFQDFYDKQNKVELRVTRRRFQRTYLGGFALVYVGVLFYLFTTNAFGHNVLNRYINLSTLAALIPIGIGIYMVFRSFQTRRNRVTGLGKMRDQSQELRQQVRFAMAAKESFEISAEGKKAGLGGTLKRASERQLTERPATLSSLIHNFRSFVQGIARSMDGRPVVIMIDELDKMIDPQRVTQLLRDIKGIFEVEQAYTLVSISNEAARFLELGTIKTRTEFNSSFDTVISIPALPPRESQLLLKTHAGEGAKDVFSRPAALAIGVLTAGIPREIIRVGDALLESGKTWSASEVCISIMKDELSAFLDQVVTTPQAVLSKNAGDAAAIALEIFRMIPGDILVNSSGVRDLASRALMCWGRDICNCDPRNNDVFNGQFQLLEEWRRLQVRLSVAHLIILSSLDLDRSMQLQDVVRIAATSATAARIRLVSYLIHIIGGLDVSPSAISEGDIASIARLMQILGQTLTEEQLLDRLKECNHQQLQRLKAWHLLESRRKGLTRQWTIGVI